MINLSDSEFDLLWLLASAADQVVSREFLTKSLRGIEYDGLDRTVDNKIVTLRKSYVMTLARRNGSLRYAVRDIYLCLTLGKPKLI